MGLHLITGGNGFLGSFIARELLKRGERVRVLDVISDAQGPKEVDYRQASVLDERAVADAMVGVDYVHHNAALVPLRKAGDLFWRVNVDGTKVVLAAAKAANVKHFSHMSSSAVFGNVTTKDCPIKTNPPELHPIEIYGRSKHAAEKLVNEEMASGTLSCSIIRPRTIIGTERLGIFQILFEWINEGRNIYIIGSGENLFQLAHVDDIVNVSIETALNHKSGYYNIGTDRFSTLRKDLEQLCKLADTGSIVKSLPTALAIPALYTLDKIRLSPLGPWHYLTYHKPYYFDLNPTFEELKWRPKYSNVEMLWESYNWYLAHKSEMSNRAEKSAHKGTLKQKALRLLKAIS